MKLKRYHKKVFLPELNYKWFLKSLPKLWVTPHCQQRLLERSLRIPSLDELQKGEIFEVYLKHDKIERLCIRLHIKSQNLCYVIAENGAIITTWACNENNKYDRIDYSVYERS